ncbi:MAG: hypothetical protein SAL70_21975 [Scytonema sp. PMC 1070.18]|nr:hypothetical protein [Scytonema sp. PMC 1070.18]
MNKNVERDYLPTSTESDLALPARLGVMFPPTVHDIAGCVRVAHC